MENKMYALYGKDGKFINGFFEYDIQKVIWNIWEHNGECEIDETTRTVRITK